MACMSCYSAAVKPLIDALVAACPGNISREFMSFLMDSVFIRDGIYMCVQFEFLMAAECHRQNNVIIFLKIVIVCLCGWRCLMWTWGWDSVRSRADAGASHCSWLLLLCVNWVHVEMIPPADRIYTSLLSWLFTSLYPELYFI